MRRAIAEKLEVYLQVTIEGALKRVSPVISIGHQQLNLKTVTLEQRIKLSGSPMRVGPSWTPMWLELGKNARQPLNDVRSQDAYDLSKCPLFAHKFSACETRSVLTCFFAKARRNRWRTQDGLASVTVRPFGARTMSRGSKAI